MSSENGRHRRRHAVTVTWRSSDRRRTCQVAPLGHRTEARRFAGTASAVRLPVGEQDRILITSAVQPPRTPRWTDTQTGSSPEGARHGDRRDREPGRRRNDDEGLITTNADIAHSTGQLTIIARRRHEAQHTRRDDDPTTFSDPDVETEHRQGHVRVCCEQLLRIARHLRLSSTEPHGRPDGRPPRRYRRPDPTEGTVLRAARRESLEPRTDSGNSSNPLVSSSTRRRRRGWDRATVAATGRRSRFDVSEENLDRRRPLSGNAFAVTPNGRRRGRRDRSRSELPGMRNQDPHSRSRARHHLDTSRSTTRRPAANRGPRLRRPRPATPARKRLRLANVCNQRNWTTRMSALVDKRASYSPIEGLPSRTRRTAPDGDVHRSGRQRHRTKVHSRGCARQQLHDPAATFDSAGTRTREKGARPCRAATIHERRHLLLEPARKWSHRSETVYSGSAT